MNFKEIVETLLTEASKKDILINKLGVNEYNAEALGKIAGPLTIMLANKILEKYERVYYRESDYPRVIKTMDIKNRMALVNGSNSFVKERDQVVSIMDWFTVGLNGDIVPFKNLTFDELYQSSVAWHENLQIGEAKIDYKETNEIILDFRKDGVGLYWADLAASYCPDEADRMGHCARSSGNLYTLRSYKKIGEGHTLNDSHLTSSIKNGKILQMKGKNNSKPKEAYHQFIIPLLLSDLVTGFGYEYDSDNDFKIADLKEEQIRSLYEQKPELFNGFREKRILKDLGLIDSAPVIIETHININEMDEYINVGRDTRNDIFELILSGDYYDLWDNSEHADWRGAITYHVNKENISLIWDKLKEFAKNEGDEINESYDIEDAIEDFDNNYDIRNAIKSSVNDAEASDYSDHLYKSVKVALEEYGEVRSLTDEGAEMLINVDDVISKMSGIDNSDLDDIEDNCDGDPSCVLSELLSNDWIDKPRLNIDHRYSPDVEDGYFNEILKERLNEF